MNIPKGHVLKLKKALYGLKEAAKRWNCAFNEYVINALRFKQSEHDPCLFSREFPNGIVYLLLYVDDIILSGDNQVLA